jgi:MFS family permease
LVCFVARRIGAPIFGHYVDRIGRKALTATALFAWSESGV